MTDKGGGSFLKPWKDGWLENLVKWLGAAWLASMAIGALGLDNPRVPDQYFSGLYWGRVLNSMTIGRDRQP